MAQLTINLHITERDALFQFAKQEARDPRSQAKLIIRRALTCRGFLPAPPRRVISSERVHVEGLTRKVES